MSYAQKIHLIALAKCVFKTAVKAHFHPPGYDTSVNVLRPRECSSAPSAPIPCTLPGAQLLFEFAFKMIPLTEPYDLPLHSIPHSNCYFPTVIDLKDKASDADSFASSKEGFRPRPHPGPELELVPPPKKAAVLLSGYNTSPTFNYG